MKANPTVLLSGFGDEAAVSKTAVEQLAVYAAIGLEYYSLRFIDVGGGIKNVMQLTAEEVRQLKQLHADYGMKVATLGSPIGKIKLRDVEDGTKNRYVPADRYLKEEVARAIELAQAFGTKLLRGFSFYHPHATDPANYLTEVTDRVGAIAEACGNAGCLFGLEVEANLVGQSGRLLGEIYRKVKSPHLLLIFDGANLAAQGLSTQEVFEEYLAMRDGIGWMHIKDYRVDRAAKQAAQRAGGGRTVDEESLHDFVPADRGDSGHEAILRDLREMLPGLEHQLRQQGVPGVFLDLEPHLKKGGQFGGFSGPDGVGIALRALCRLLDYVEIDYRLRDFPTLRSPGG